MVTDIVNVFYCKLNCTLKIVIIIIKTTTNFSYKPPIIYILS